MMRQISLLLLLGALLFLAGCEKPASDLRPVNLRCNYLEDPLSIEGETPRLSWYVTAEGRGRQQTAYRIIVASSEALLNGDQGDLWDTQKVPSSETVNLPYTGKELGSRSSCFWKVKVWDEKDVSSEWSATARWSMGLLELEDWSAIWIGLDDAMTDTTYKIKPWGNGLKNRGRDYRPLPSPYLRKEFELERAVATAKIYASAFGIYELYVNGHRVGEDYFTPGWTDYRRRICYNTYEVGQWLHKGTNTIAAVVGDGWYAGNSATRGQYYYGDQLRLKAQLNIDFDDESFGQIVTDTSWKAAYGPIQEADLQAGETYDARLEMPGWNTSGFDDRQWAKVVVTDTHTLELEAYRGIPVRKTSEVKPVSVFEQDSGVYIVDMGQNFAGWARLQVDGARGQKVVMRFGEKLNPDSTLHTRNLRTARCTDTYILRGGGPETYEPRFTYHGFQYIEVTGYPGQLTKDDLTGVVLRSDLEEVGQFTCSNPLINQLQSNILWSQRSNYFEVPTDNPQRDERCGWLGDAQVFMRTASYNMNITPFFSKWMFDVVDTQYENGRLPCTAPYVYRRVAAGWADAVVIVPWKMFQLYNDTQMLAQHYPVMARWMDYVEQESDGPISGIGTFGDWQNVDSETPEDLIATVYYYHTACLMAKMAALTKRSEDEQKYEALSQSIKTAFNEEFVNDSGHVKSRTQTAYLMALHFDLLPDSKRALAEDYLAKTIADHDYTLTTGILGTHLLLPVLTEMGRLDLAYRLLLNTAYPSWGHQIANGANTIWERWDSYSHEKGFHEDKTNSLNQYAYGAVGEWFYSTVGGIDYQAPGYKQIVIRPRPGGGLTQAEASYRSIRGMISSSWNWDGKVFQLEVEIPANCEALVYIPSDAEQGVTESDQPLEQAAGVQFLRQEDGAVVVQVGSGRYAFRASYAE